MQVAPCCSISTHCNGAQKCVISLAFPCPFCPQCNHQVGDSVSPLMFLACRTEYQSLELPATNKPHCLVKHAQALAWQRTRTEREVLFFSISAQHVRLQQTECSPQLRGTLEMARPCMHLKEQSLLPGPPFNGYVTDLASSMILPRLDHWQNPCRIQAGCV